MEYIKFPEKKYKTIYADPPWAEHGGGKIKRGADRHYPLMSTKEICDLPVQDISEENCHLYIWTTNNFLLDAFKVIEAWGFTYVTCITWMKDRQGLGQYYRGITEHYLFARKGMLPYKCIDGKRQQGVTGFYHKKMEHSVKPEIMRQMIENVSYMPAIELFARRPSPGWDCWGNEMESDDSLDQVVNDNMTNPQQNRLFTT